MLLTAFGYYYESLYEVTEKMVIFTKSVCHN